MDCVQITNTKVIQPSVPTPDHVLSLSTLECQPLLRFTVEFLLIFKPGQRSEWEVASTLELALASVLVPYYPFAGRIRESLNDEGLEVVCKGQGVPFIEAVSDSHTVHSFSGTPAHESQWRPFLSHHVPDILSGEPPVVLQLTWLKDGGVALAVGLNHCLSDGIGIAEFLNALADVARTRSTVSELNIEPVWDRHLLDHKGPVEKPRFFTEYTSTEDVDRVFSSRISNEKLVPTSVEFKKVKLNELKRVAMFASPKNRKPFTAFEVLTAQVWLSWATAMNLPPTQVIRLLFTVNIRGRVVPCLRPGYYGNGFVITCAETSLKELTERGLGHAAMMVREAKQKVDDHYVRSLVQLLTNNRDTAPDLTGTLVLTQWARLGFEEIDFGMGKPYYVVSPWFQWFCILMPGGQDRSDGDLRVNFSIPASAANHYVCMLQDPRSFIQC